MAFSHIQYIGKERLLFNLERSLRAALFIFFVKAAGVMNTGSVCIDESFFHWL